MKPINYISNDVVELRERIEELEQERDKLQVELKHWAELYPVSRHLSWDTGFPLSDLLRERDQLRDALKWIAKPDIGRVETWEMRAAQKALEQTDE